MYPPPEKLDYLSTVSGGGYIGSSLTWALHRQWSAGEVKAQGCEDEAYTIIPFGLSAHNFPFGTQFRDFSADDALRLVAAHSLSERFDNAYAYSCTTQVEECT